MNSLIQEIVLNNKADTIGPYLAIITEWLKRRRGVLLGLFALQCICYTYFLTIPLLSNHTFPNLWLWNYPSFQTTSEGRWFADLVVLFQGSSGVQSFQFACAIVLQAVNGLLLADLLRIKESTTQFLLAAVLCLWPLFPDYYSFSSHHITFVFGDTLCLLAALIWLRSSPGVLRIAVPAILNLLSIAAYGPKVSLVLFLSSGAFLLGIQEKRELTNSREWMRQLIRCIAMLSLAVLGYWVTLRLTCTTSYDEGKHTHINYLPEIFNGIRSAYGSISDYYTHGVGGFPPLLAWLPAGIFLAGCVCLALRVRTNGFLSLCATIVILALVPVMLRSPWIINCQSYENCARIGTVNGYAFVFFLGVVITCAGPKWIGKSLAIIVLYFLIILAAQQNNVAGIKSIYESNMINRILARCDAVALVREGTETPLVVVGEYPPFEVGKYVKYPQQYSIQQISTSAFAPYRQIEILNFLEGKRTFKRPTTDEVKEALVASTNRKPWPHPESVFMSRNILVVLLQQGGPGIQTTWDQLRTN